MENSYLEVKVSFIHIVVMLVGVIVVGVFLFYLGYQAGKSSAQNEIRKSEDIKGTEKSEEIRLADGKDKKEKMAQARKPEDPSISEEIKLHQLPAQDNEQIQAKPVQRESYWTVQVGAFSDYANAKNYAAKFQEMGYPAEINTIVKDNAKLHRVRVGNFKSRSEAREAKQKLEQMEKKKFNIVKAD
jgi:cell division septation protein DedD